MELRTGGGVAPHEWEDRGGGEEALEIGIPLQTQARLNGGGHVERVVVLPAARRREPRDAVRVQPEEKHLRVRGPSSETLGGEVRLSERDIGLVDEGLPGLGRTSIDGVVATVGTRR